MPFKNHKIHRFFCIFLGYKKIVRKLLRYANVNVPNKNGETPIFYAVDGCNIKNRIAKIFVFQIYFIEF